MKKLYTQRAPLIVSLALLVALMLLGWIAFVNAAVSQTGQAGVGEVKVSEQTTISPEFYACTRDAKICPDGTAVGRTGPRCEFAQCPGAYDPDQGLINGCTREAKICPDGTTVGRSGPQCAFEACPGETVSDVPSSSDIDGQGVDPEDPTVISNDDVISNNDDKTITVGIPQTFSFHLIRNAYGMQPFYPRFEYFAAERT